MDIIKNFNLPEHINNLYENEASSTIALAKEVTNKINELVNAYNTLNKWQLETHQQQDGKINKAVVFMKDNLINSLNDLMELLKKSGYVDNRIKLYAETLTARLETAIKGLTVDSETIDGRVSANNQSFSTIGESIRKFTGVLSSMLHDVAKPETENVEGTNKSGYYSKTGELSANASYLYKEAPATSGDVFYVHSNYGYAVPAVVFLGANGLIQYYLENESGVVTEDYNRFIVAPDGATKIIVNGRTADEPQIRKVTNWKINLESINEYLDNLTNVFESGTEVLSDNLVNTTEQGFVISENKVIPADFSDGIQPVVSYTGVTGGERYRILCSYAYTNQPYVFLDKYGEPLSNVESADGTATVKIFDGVVTIPFGCTMLVIANQLTTNSPACKKVLSFIGGKQWSNLKWCCFGDSLTEVNSRASKRYFDYIADKTGINIVNCGVGGTGYARGNESNNAFYQRTDTIPLDSDVITFFGSFNDLGSTLPIGTASDTGTATIGGCINTTLDNLYTKIPLANVGIIAPCPWETTKPDTQGNAFNYVELLKTICELRSIPFLDLWRASNLRPWDSNFKTLVYSKDDGNGVHPDETGHRILSSRIYTFIESLIATY